MKWEIKSGKKNSEIASCYYNSFIMLKVWNLIIYFL